MEYSKSHFQLKSHTLTHKSRANALFPYYVVRTGSGMHRTYLLLCFILCTVEIINLRVAIRYADKLLMLNAPLDSRVWTNTVPNAL